MSPPDGFTAESAIIDGKFLSEEEDRYSVPTAEGRIFIEPTLASPRRAGAEAAELLAESGVDEVRVRASLDGKGAGYALEALGIEFTPQKQPPWRG